jgi:hypothetical protein
MVQNAFPRRGISIGLLVMLDVITDGHDAAWVISSDTDGGRWLESSVTLEWVRASMCRSTLKSDVPFLTRWDDNELPVCVFDLFMCIFWSKLNWTMKEVQVKSKR